jgi:hypothetical protein
MARKGDTPEYVNRMQHEVFEVLAEARILEDLRRIEPKARQVLTGDTWTSWRTQMKRILPSIAELAS